MTPAQDICLAFLKLIREMPSDFEFEAKKLIQKAYVSEEFELADSIARIIDEINRSHDGPIL